MTSLEHTYSVWNAILKVSAERFRQLERYTPEYDDTHNADGGLADAGAAYAFAAGDVKMFQEEPPEPYWPWQDAYWHPTTDRIAMLVKGAALIVAEIERLDRKEKTRNG